MLRLWTKCTDKQSITKLNYTFTKGGSITQTVYISFSIFIFQCVHSCASTYHWQLRLLISVGDFALSIGALCNSTTRPERRHPLGQTSFCLVRPTPISYPIFISRGFLISLMMETEHASETSTSSYRIQGAPSRRTSSATFTVRSPLHLPNHL
jgi:hypothetical protein